MNSQETSVVEVVVNDSNKDNLDHYQMVGPQKQTVL